MTDLYKKCEYCKECKNYDHDSICCTFLYELCLYRKRETNQAEFRRKKDLESKVNDQEYLSLWGGL